MLCECDFSGPSSDEVRERLLSLESDTVTTPVKRYVRNNDSLLIPHEFRGDMIVMVRRSGNRNDDPFVLPLAHPFLYTC